ncbi:MAG: hypothetical protein M3468_04975 [Acidobacteriota bacterium]|nr:hypothetical protein [Acidobacteriota bacterium]
MTERRHDDEPHDQPPRVDVALVLLVLLGLAVLVFLTFDLWMPHRGGHR